MPPGVPVMAVDLPSGLDADTGLPAATYDSRGCTPARSWRIKQGFLTPGADRFTGQVHVLDIGAPRKLVDEMLAPAE